MPAALRGKLRVRVYHLRPIACQTVTTTTAHRIVTGAYAMLYRGMDRAQLDAAYNNPRPSPSATRFSPIGRHAVPRCGANTPAAST